MTLSGAWAGAERGAMDNGVAAQTEGDYTFASAGHSLADGSNVFTAVARNVTGAAATNRIGVYLPATATFIYDTNGNLVNDGQRVLEYDDANQLLAVSVTGQYRSEFAYDGLGRRRIQCDYAWQGGAWVKTNETRFVWDGLVVAQERDSNNVVRVTYTRGLDLSGTMQGAGGIGGLLARTDGSGSVYYHADAGGNVTTLVNGQGQVVGHYSYDPFGRLTGQWGSMAEANQMRFSSMPWHRASGLSLYPFRGYDPNLQRWLTRDPIGEAGGVNLYGFVGNNPINRIDPYGLVWYNPVDWYNGIVDSIADPIGRLWGGGIQAQGNAAINDMLSAQGYNGMQDFQMQHPGFGGDITAGNTDATAAAANLLSGSAQAYLQAAQSIAVGGIRWTRCSGLRPQKGYLGSTKHGLKWNEGAATAKTLNTAQGKWGSLADLEYAADKAATLEPGKGAFFPAPPGSQNVVYPKGGGAPIPASRIWVRNNGNGTFHGAPWE